MGLCLLLGPEGRPKTEYLASLLGKGGKVRILVPDQYTLAAEKRYLGLAGEKKFASAEVLSFKRFALKVFEQRGGLAYEFIGDGGRQALLSKAVKQTSLFFTHYPRGYYSMKFVRLIMPMFRSLKTAGITPEQLRRTAEKQRNAKLSDLALIYGGFEALLAGGFFDPDDDFTRLCRLLDREKLFAGDVFFVDFFRTFNSGERRILEALLGQGAEVFVTLPCRKISFREDFSLLSEVEVCAGKLQKAAEKRDCSFSVKEFCAPDPEKPAGLQFLCEHLFSEPAKVFSSPDCGVSFYLGDDIFDEIQFVASEISRLVRTGGYCYSDFVVAARDIDGYAGVIDPVFAEYDIPLFYHRKTPLVQKSVALLVITLLQILSEGLTPESVLTCLKTGFFGVSDEDLWLFENYLELWSVKAPALQKEFVLPARFLSGREEEKDLLCRVETVRRDFVAKIARFRKQTEKKTVLEISEALYSFLMSLGLEESLRASAELYLKFGEQALYAEQAQVYDLIVQALDEIVLTCGGDPVSPAEYSDLLLSVLDSKDIAILPTSADEVMAGNCNRLPYMGQKVVFVLGMTEGVFPESPSSDALLSEEDKADLSADDITAGMTNRQKVMYERLLAFFTFTAPSRRLILSCPERDRRSVFFDMLRRMFPSAAVVSSPKSRGKGFEERVYTERSAFSVYAATGLLPLKQYFEQKPEFSSVFQKKDRRRLSPASSLLLFGRDIRLRPSRAEQFFQCPFSYLICDGFQIRAPGKIRVNGVQAGTFMHSALERLLPRVLRGESPENAVKGFGEEYSRFLFGGDAPSSSLREYFSMLERKAEKVLQRFAEEIPKTGFVPLAYEARIGPGGLEVPSRTVPGGSVSLHGKIDRIDRFSADRDYLRIVDYKTGDKSVDLEKIADGTEMQMPLYLSAVLSAVKNEPAQTENVAAAGVMYLRVNPKIKTVARGSSGDDVSRAVWGKSVSGLILDRPEVLSAAGADSEKMQKLSEEDFSSLFETVEENVARFAASLLEGTMPIAPASLRMKALPGQKPCPESCRYCPYEPYCPKK